MANKQAFLILTHDSVTVTAAFDLCLITSLLARLGG